VKCTSDASGTATIAIEAPARGFDSLNVGVVVGVRVGGGTTVGVSGAVCVGGTVRERGKPETLRLRLGVRLTSLGMRVGVRVPSLGMSEFVAVRGAVGVRQTLVRVRGAELVAVRVIVMFALEKVFQGDHVGVGNHKLGDGVGDRVSGWVTVILAVCVLASVPVCVGTCVSVAVVECVAAAVGVSVATSVSDSVWEGSAVLVCDSVMFRVRLKVADSSAVHDNERLCVRESECETDIVRSSDGDMVAEPQRDVFK
jgi:putative Ca2+/H+ antiporter (TMEM165/GDT1 family)